MRQVTCLITIHCHSCHYLFSNVVTHFAVIVYLLQRQSSILIHLCIPLYTYLWYPYTNLSYSLFLKKIIDGCYFLDEIILYFINRNNIRIQIYTKSYLCVNVLKSLPEYPANSISKFKSISMKMKYRSVIFS